MHDIHTHIYWESFDQDREAVLERAQAAGVKEMLVVGTSTKENQHVLTLTEQHETLFASIGIHPNVFRAPVEENWQQILKEQVMNQKVVAVGECGLDYSESHGAITEEQKMWQRQGFVEQLGIARENNLPVIVHCRATTAVSDDAYFDLFEIIKTDEHKNTTFILHCYMGSVTVTKEFLGLPNVYFSFTGNITYPVKQAVAGGNFELTETVKIIPLNKVFTETDCPFLAPQSQRGKRNEPAFVLEVAEKIAELQGVSVSEVEQKTEKNFKKVFFPEN